jgi:hypothetical protein
MYARLVAQIEFNEMDAGWSSEAFEVCRVEGLAKLLIEKGLITQEEFIQKISAERATYQKLLNPTQQ